MNLYYATPNMVADAKLGYPVQWPTRAQDDLFPYADGAHSYWTGYMTSRPALKGYIRDSSIVLNAARQLQAWTAPASALPPSSAPGGDEGVVNGLTTLEEALGIASHHDAIAGTSQQHVANDYAWRIARGRADTNGVIGDALAQLTGAVLPAGAAFSMCDLANATICPPLEDPSNAGPVLVAVYNSQVRVERGAGGDVPAAPRPVRGAARTLPAPLPTSRRSHSRTHAHTCRASLGRRSP